MLAVEDALLCDGLLVGWMVDFSGLVVKGWLWWLIVVFVMMVEITM